MEQAKDLPLSRIYAAQHTYLIQLGHEVNYPAVLAARKELNAKWMTAMLSKSAAAPVSGILSLD